MDRVNTEQYDSSNTKPLSFNNLPHYFAYFIPVEDNRTSLQPAHFLCLLYKL